HVLELGCGSGRYTVRIAADAGAVLAVDFSLAALKNVAARAQAGWHLGLVQADCTRFAVRPRSFQRVLSTLVSNLSSGVHRQEMFRLAAAALGPNGKFIFSTHHHSLFERLIGAPQAGHYPENDIYRYLFRIDEIVHETGHHFRRIDCRPIQIRLPLLGRLGLPVASASHWLEKIPLLNRFGELLLVTAEP